MNNFAISSVGIGDALTRSAASLSAANNTMEESIALITAMNTTLQDPEKVGTTLKTITMYLRAAKAELEDAGESTDGMAISTSKLRESVLALTSNKVDVMLNPTTFKSTYQIIKEISQVWSSMADVDQAALLELLGGKRNANATASLIQNFDVAEKALESATNSAGSAAAENEKYLDSILGKVAQFNAAFETLSAIVIDSGFSKGVVDAGTAILDIITELIGGIGTLNTLAIGLGTALSFGGVKSIFSPFQADVKPKTDGTGKFSGSFSIGITSQLSQDKAGIDAYNAALQTYKDSLKSASVGSAEATEAAEKFAAATNDAKTAVSRGAAAMIDANKAQIDSLVTDGKLEELQGKAGDEIKNTTKSLVTYRLKTIAATAATTAMNAAISFGISVLAQLAISGIDYLINREERIAEAAEDAKTAIADTSESLKAQNKTVEDAKVAIAAYGKEVQYVNGRLTSKTLSTEQLEQYSSAVGDLTELFPELISGYDAEGNAVINLSGQYDTLCESIDRANASRQAMFNSEIDERMPDVVDGIVDKVDTLSGEYDDLVAQIIDLKTSPGVLYSGLAKKSDAYSYTAADGSAVYQYDISFDQMPNMSSAEVANMMYYLQEAANKWFSSNGYNVPTFYENAITWNNEGSKYRITPEVLSEFLHSEEVQSDETMARYFAESARGKELELQQLRVARNSKRDQIEAAWAEANQTLLQYFNSNSSFQEMDSIFNGALSKVISGARWDKLIGSDVSWDEIKSYVEDNLVAVLGSVDLSTRSDIETMLSNGAASLTATEYEDVLNHIKEQLSAIAPDGGEAVMDILFGSMSYSSDDIADLNEAVFGKESEMLNYLKGSLMQKIDLERELLEAKGESSEAVDEETRAYEDFFDRIESGNATIAELEALTIMATDGSLNASNSFKEWKESYDELVYSISGTSSYNDIVESLGDVKSAADSAYEAYNRYHNAVSRSEFDSWEKDTLYEKYAEDFQAFKKLYEEGKIGSTQFKNYMNQFGIDSIDELDAYFAKQSSLYAGGKEGLESLASYIEYLNKAGELSTDIASVDFSSGYADFSFDIHRVEEFADALGMTEDQLWAFIHALQVYSADWESMSAEELQGDFLSHGLIQTGEDGQFYILYEDIAKYTGKSRDEINKLLDKINELDEYKANPVKLLGDETALNSKAGSTDSAEDSQATIELKVNGATSEELQEIQNQLMDIDGLDTSIDIEDNTVTIIGRLSRLTRAIKKIEDLSPEISIRIVSDGRATAIYDFANNGSKSGLPIIGAKSSGTKNADPGLSLLGDEYSPDGSPKPELVVSGGSAYLAGINGPTTGYLKSGDRVYTYSETKQILNSRNNKVRIPSFAGGHTTLERRGFGAGSLWSTVSSSVGSLTIGSDFESQYKYHQHLLNMEQESQKEYLSWLDKAYKDAYARGEIDLDNYYKYQEEVFQLIRELVQDNLNDAEHYIDMLGHYDGNDGQIIEIYKELISAIEKEIAAARSAGLDDNDDYIQNLQKQYWEYVDAIEDIQGEISDNVKDSLEDLIDLRVKMIKQDLKNEKEALKDKKDYLKDFYNKQKEILQDAYDDEKYFEEQAEKRKAVADLQMQLNQLEYDDSAWAQKKRLQLLQELRDAQKELDDFEKDHALEKAQELIDDTYDAQEEEIDKEIDLIEEKEDHAKNLRDQAIADLREADHKMYEDMIAWNAQYGDGIDATITEKWENATQAMSNYYDLNKEYYEGIDVTKGVYPEFLPKDNGSWSTNPVSGDNPSNQNPQQPSTPDNSSGKAGSVSNIVPQLKYGSRGNDVSALQTALKEMGLYSDKIDGHFGPNTRAAVIAFQRNNGISADGIVGPNTKAKFKVAGYKSGTSSATAGLHEIWEDGSEYIFTSSDGRRFRIFSGGEKVLNADATNFLYDFANNGNKVLESFMNRLIDPNRISSINSSAYSPIVNMGDIIVQGGASERTVSQIRRAQRDQVNTLLREFGRLRQ